MKRRWISAYFLVLLFALLWWVTTPASAQSGVFIAPNSSNIPSPITGQTWLLNSSNYSVNVWTGSAYQSVSAPFSNYMANRTPTATDDISKGYVVGSSWFNQANGLLYLCSSNTLNAAVWVQINVSITSIALSNIQQSGAATGQSAVWNGSTWAAANPTIAANTQLTNQVQLANGGTGLDNTSISANKIFAGPTSGGSGTAGFRSLVSADIPLIPLSTLFQSGATNGQVPAWNGSAWAPTSTGSGTVTSVSAGTLSPLFTTSVATPTSTPAISFTLSNAAANTVLSNNTAGSAAPAYNALSVTAGTGLSGGGNLTTNPTISLSTPVTLANGGLGVNGSSVSQNAVFVGPSTGGSGSASFRALVAADIPNLPVSQLTQSGATTNQILAWNGSAWAPTNSGAGSGSVTTISVGNLSPLFTSSVATPTTTPSVTYTLSNAAANTILSNATGGSAAPAYNNLTLTAGTGLSGGGSLASSPTLNLATPVSLTNGGIGVSGNSISPNLVFAGPTGGGAGNATFRSLVVNDIPFSSPGPIGNTTPNTATFTQATVQQNLYVESTSFGGNNLVPQGGSGKPLLVQENHYVGTALHGIVLDTINENGMSMPTSLAVSNQGTAGSTSYTYQVVSIADGANVANLSTFSTPVTVTTTTGNATLTLTNYNQITWAAAGTHVDGYLIFRTASGGAPNTTGYIGNTTGTSFNDTGIAADGSVLPSFATSGVSLIAHDNLYLQSGLDAVNVASQPLIGTTGANFSPAALETGTHTLQVLGNVGTPTVTVNGTVGIANWSYAVEAIYPDGSHSVVSSPGSVAGGNAVLSGSNYNTISWNIIPNAAKYQIYRTTASGTPSTTGLIGTIAPTNSSSAGMNAVATFNDTGLSTINSSLGDLTNTSSRVLWSTDNVCDVGASGANRPRNVYTGNNVYVGNHLHDTGTGVSIAAGSGAGLSPTVSLGANSNDLDGVINVTTGSTPTAGAVICTITFGAAYTNTPAVVFSPMNAATAALSGNGSVYVTPSTTNFTLTAGSTGLAGSTAYKWSYHAAQ